MTMRATLDRNAGSADAYGHKAVSWSTFATVACYAWAGTGRARRTSHGDEMTVVTDSPGMIVPSGTDITEDDRVNVIKDRRGTTLFGTMYIDAVLKRSDHLEVRLREYA